MFKFIGFLISLDADRLQIQFHRLEGKPIYKSLSVYIISGQQSHFLESRILVGKTG